MVPNCKPTGTSSGLTSFSGSGSNRRSIVPPAHHRFPLLCILAGCCKEGGSGCRSWPLRKLEHLRCCSPLDFWSCCRGLRSYGCCRCSLRSLGSWWWCWSLPDPATWHEGWWRHHRGSQVRYSWCQAGGDGQKWIIKGLSFCFSLLKLLEHHWTQISVLSSISLRKENEFHCLEIVCLTRHLTKHILYNKTHSH